MALGDNPNEVIVTEEDNPELFEALSAVHRANHMPNRISFNGAVYRVYDRGGKFVMEARAGGMQHYDSVSMAAPNTNLKLEQGAIAVEKNIPAKKPSASKPKRGKTSKE